MDDEPDLERVQRDIDARLKPGLTFTSVSRATWPSLRQLYNSTLTERIPDDIRDLIERLD